MMKNLLIILLIGLMPIISYAQKLKTNNVKVAYTQLPSEPMDPEFTTYSVVLYGSESSLEQVGYTRSSLIDKYFSLSSFKQVPEGGHFRIRVRVGYLKIGKNENVSFKKSIKQGDKTVKKTYYKRVVSWALPVYYTIEDYQGNVIGEGTHGTSYESFEFGSHASSYKLSKDWGEQRNIKYESWRKQGVSKNLAAMAKTIKYKYDFQSRTGRAPFETLKAKSKKFETKPFIDATETVKAAFAKMRTNEPTDALKDDVASALKFWMAEKDKYSAEDKKLKKVKYMCLYNTALTFFWLDELDEAKKYATECSKIDYNNGNIKRFLKQIETTRKAFEVNKMTHRHPNINVEDAQPPSAASFGEFNENEGKEESKAKGVDLAGAITDMDGNNIEGNFVISLAEEGEELKFGENGNVQFKYTVDGREKSSSLAPEQTKSFKFKDRSFVVQNFVVGAKGNTEAKMAILEVLYESTSINVYKYYPYDDQLGDQKIEYAFQKEGQDPVSTSGTTFLLFKKGLTNYFSDCADLAEAAGTGEFTKTEDDIIRVARVYSEMCTKP